MPMHPHGHGFTHYGVFGYEGEVWTIAGVEFIPAAAVKAGVAVVAHHKVMPFGHLPNAIAAVAPRVQVFMYGVFSIAQSLAHHPVMVVVLRNLGDQLFGYLFA